MQQRLGDGRIFAVGGVHDRHYGVAEETEPGARAEPRVEVGGGAGRREHAVKQVPRRQGGDRRIEWVRWSPHWSCYQETARASAATATVRSGSLVSRSTGRSPSR